MNARPSRKPYTLDDFDPYIGKSGQDNRHILPLPNVEDVDPLAFLNNLASGGHGMTPRWGYSRPTPDSGWTNWTQFFLLDKGEGYAVVYGSSYPKPQPRVVRFAICRHEKVGTGTAEQSRRGWHPGYCAKCGVDMTYDSGD